MGYRTKSKALVGIGTTRILDIRQSKVVILNIPFRTHLLFIYFSWYVSSAYYIKCPSCCSLEGIDAQGMWGDGGSSSIRDDSATASHTQSFRVFIDQIEDELDIKYLAEVEEKKKQEEALKKLKEVLNRID